MLFWYMDFVIFTPSIGPDDPVFIGAPSGVVTSREAGGKAQSGADMRSGTTLQNCVVLYV